MWRRLHRPLPVQEVQEGILWAIGDPHRVSGAHRQVAGIQNTGLAGRYYL